MDEEELMSFLVYRNCEQSVGHGHVGRINSCLVMTRERMRYSRFQDTMCDIFGNPLLGDV